MELLLGRDENLIQAAPAREIEKMRPPQMEQPQDHKTLSSWGSSSTPIPVGGTAQQGTGNPRGSWDPLMTSSFCQSSSEKRCYAGPCFQHQGGARGQWGCSDHEVVEIEILRALRIATLENQTLASLGIFLVC